jgi:predicted MFS family arabinose efflux permease
MNRLRLLLLISFIESFATVCVERGVYFFATGKLNFTRTENLWLAVWFGLAYAAGAFGSHRLSARFKEKRMLLATLWAQVLTHAALAVLWRRPEFIFAGTAVLGMINGIKWPVIESYISAGRSPSATASTVGYFNIAWAAAVPVALVVAGPILGTQYPWLLFVLPAAVNIVSMFLIAPLPISPVHLPQDHPERLSEPVLRRVRSLLTGSRWILLCSYGTLWVLAALMPIIFADRLRYSIKWSTGLSSVLDVVRTLAFVLLQFYRGWHFRMRYIIAAMIGLPLGFFMIAFAANLPTVLIGEIVFGLSGGLIYYCALYYAMVAQNASVEAGGTHEGLIGIGFAVGPVAGLVGVWLQQQKYVSGDDLAMLIGVGPMFLICSAGAAWHLFRARGIQRVKAVGCGL